MHQAEYYRDFQVAYYGNCCHIEQNGKIEHHPIIQLKYLQGYCDINKFARQCWTAKSIFKVSLFVHCEHHRGVAHGKNCIASASTRLYVVLTNNPTFLVCL